MAGKRQTIKKTGFFHGKSNELGGGGRFEQLKDQLMKDGKSADSAKAIAASVGRKANGPEKFQAMAAKGRKRKS